MKGIKRILASVVKLFRMEESLIKGNRSYLLPKSHTYSKPTLRIIERSGVAFKVDISDYMQWHLFADIDKMTMRIIEPFIKNDSVVLDVGANCGEFTLKVAGLAYQKNFKDTRVHAFEPNPFIVERLKESAALNPHLESFVKVNQIALGDSVGKSVFTFSFQHTGAGRIGQDSGMGERIEIQIDTLDNYVLANNISKVDFIKLDVEGYEANVLSKSMTVLHRDRPAFYIEVTDKWLKRNGYSKEYIYDTFERNHYTVMVNSRNQLVRRDVAQDLHKQHNILCIPQ